MCSLSLRVVNLEETPDRVKHTLSTLPYLIGDEAQQ